MDSRFRRLISGYRRHFGTGRFSWKAVGKGLRRFIAAVTEGAMKMTWGLAPLLAVVLCGCQSAPKTVTGRDGRIYTNTIHNLTVWFAPGFSGEQLRGKAVVVAETKSEVAEQQKPKEKEQFERLRHLIADQLYYALDAKKSFQRVISPNTSGPAADADYKFDTSVVEYYAGNAALRFTVGFSAGYPSITVHGIVRDKAGEPVFRFETQREFEARPFEYGDEQILENNVKDLAKDVADYLDRVVNGKPLKG
jgi:hypothetical protein